MLLDKNGHRVQVDDRMIHVNVSGQGRLLAVDSGELRVPGDSFFRNEVLTQFGRALAVVQSSRQSGPITIDISVDGIGSKTLEIQTE